ncbi:MAG: hypothetical protein JXR48_13490 [Candidatus Delongbacteria bacterium]|nr:hypothetical protein [Candidatus Delongbacteria bacterium]MBN2835969.1 hypothetical protein [Candidatus Delongbacteria bacterium]
MKLNAELRYKVVKTALEKGITYSAEIYKISRVSVSKWVKRYKLEGEFGLKTKSRLLQTHPSSLSDDIVSTIITAKTVYPKWSASKIIDEFEIEASESTVLKKISQYISEDNKVNSVVIQFNTVPLQVQSLYKYIQIAHNLKSDTIIIGFTNENISQTNANFAEYVFKNTTLLNGFDHVDKVQVGMGRFFHYAKSSGPFYNIVSNYTNSPPIKVKLKNSYYLDLKHLISKLNFKSLNELRISSIIEILKFNLNKFVNYRDIKLCLPLFERLNFERFSMSFKFARKFIIYLTTELETKAMNLSLKMYIPIFRYLIENKYVIPEFELLLSLVIEKASFNEKFDICEEMLIIYKMWIKKNSLTSTRYYFISAKFNEIKLNYTQAQSFYIDCINNCAEDSIDLKIESYSNLSNIYKKTGQKQLSIDTFLKLETLSKQYNRPKDLYFAQLNLGTYFLTIGETEKGRFYLLKAREVAKRIEDYSLEATVLSRIGGLYLFRNNIDEAEKYYKPLIELGYKNTNLQLQGESLSKLAMLSLRKNDYTQSILYADNYLSISRKIKSDIGRAIAYRIKGICLMSLKKYKEALKCHLKDLEISTNMKNLEFIATAMGNIGAVYLSKKKYKIAINRFNQQLHLSENIDNIRLKFTAITNLGICSLQLEHYSNAILYFDKQLKLAKRNNEVLFVGLAYQGKFYAYKGLNHYDMAFKCLRNCKRHFKINHDLFRICEVEIEEVELNLTIKKRKINKRKIIRLEEQAKLFKRDDLLERIQDLKNYEKSDHQK